ncbi:MAG TPA: Zn-ribbon domain-containing OB-fold protein [Armatimonadota bacterium]
MDVPRLHRLKGALLNLEGSTCAQCGDKAFPARRRCSACGAKDIVPYRFQGAGTLSSFSEIFASPDGYQSPYLVGLVHLDEGPTVMAQITDVDPDTIATGIRMEAVVRRIHTDGETGLIVYGYKFRPAL